MNKDPRIAEPTMRWDLRPGVTEERIIFSRCDRIQIISNERPALAPALSSLSVAGADCTGHKAVDPARTQKNQAALDTSRLAVPLTLTARAPQGSGGVSLFITLVSERPNA